MPTQRNVLSVLTVLTSLMMAGCGGDSPKPPSGPTPPPGGPGGPAPGQVTANAYILMDATTLGSWAFGDEPVVIYKGERLRWVNADNTTHVIVADTPGATDFVKTEPLAPGGEQSLTMTRLGTTTIHCSIHPSMTGTLIVREH